MGVVSARPSVLRALGQTDPPGRVDIGACEFHREDIFKHDSWAATALYRSDAGRRVVCKFNRTQSIFGFPMSWLGRLLARRERLALTRLAGVQGIPAESGPVSVSGKTQANAVAHEYVPGHPLRRGEQVPPGFFSNLCELLNAVHRRQMAYVDLHKSENIIVGADGHPYLIDFQVSFVPRPTGQKSRLGRAVLAKLQDADLYHLAKHIRRSDRGQLPLIGSEKIQKPGWIVAHRKIAVPLRRLRRWLLTILHVRAPGGQASSEVFPEHAVRQSASRAA